MEKQWKKLREVARKVRLAENEKNRLRLQMKNFMDLHPVREKSDGRHSILSRIFGMMKMNNLSKAMPVIGLILALLLTGGGVSYAAEGSVPGDTLYPVKIHMNEGVGFALSFTDEAKVKWEARLAERRLEEAEELATEGVLDTDTREDLEKRFRSHASRLANRIDVIEGKLGPEVAARLTSAFEASLDAHARILERIVDQVESSEELDALADVVDEEAEDAEEDRLEAEDDLDKKVSLSDRERAARGRLKSVEEKIKEVNRFLSRKEDRLKEKGIWVDGIFDDQRNVLYEADLLVQEGLTRIDDEEYGDAFRLFQEAHRLADTIKRTLRRIEKLGLEKNEAREESIGSSDEGIGFQDDDSGSVFESDDDTSGEKNNEEDDEDSDGDSGKKNENYDDTSGEKKTLHDDNNERKDSVPFFSGENTQ